MELVAPAGNWAMLNAAVKAGADAVYFGLQDFNMRHSAKNFSLKDLDKIGKLKVKKYLCLNTIMFDRDFKKIEKILDKAKKNVDAVVCWDMGVLNLVRKRKIPVHLSTQASTANSEALEFYKKSGVKRVVLARELSLEQIKKLKKAVEVEVFVHGAMCMAISGRCFLSNDLFGENANRGKCIQPCRRTYNLIDRDTGKKVKIERDYILSVKDLCALRFIDKLKGVVDAVKIEGRSKSPEYVKTAVEVYREAIDEKLSEKRVGELVSKLKTVYNRGFSEGFYFGEPGESEYINHYGSKVKRKKKVLGVVLNFLKKKNVAILKIYTGSLKIGDRILVIGNKTGVVEQEIKSMEIEHEKVNKVGKGGLAGVLMDNDVRKNDKVYLVK